MRIAYIAAVESDRSQGIVDKITSHIQAWRRAGHAVKLFALSPGPATWEGLDDALLFNQRASRGIRRLFDMNAIAAAVRAWGCDLAFVRFTPYSPGLGRVMRDGPVVIERNINDRATYGRQHACYKVWFHRATRDRLLGGAAGFCAVTHELGDELHQFGKPVLITGNAIDLSRIEPASPPNNEQLRAIFIDAPGGRAHGLDKIMAFARTVPAWRFDVVGFAQREITDDLPRNVHFHGYLRRHDYDGLMRRADVAFSTMALHRNQMDEAAPLKVREYLAYGIPVVSAYIDPDFADDTPHILRLPNRDGNLANACDQVTAFAERWRGRRVPRDSVGHLDMADKESARLAFFRSLLERMHLEQ